MTAVRRALLTLALFEVACTVLGAVELALAPAWFAPMLDGTAFEGQHLLAAALLGLVVGGPQWLAAATSLLSRLRPRLPVAHAAAGTVMCGWILGECLVLRTFMWPHALWGGLGVLQVLLVCALLGALRPSEPQAS